MQMKDGDADAENEMDAWCLESGGKTAEQER